MNLGSHEPVLRIASGDTVVTTTLDAFGGDVHDQRIMPRGNPQTGPFYVEGAEPGDSIAFQIDRITPNRDTGYTHTALMSNVVDPDFVRSLPEQIRSGAEWRIDRVNQTVTLVKPQTKLGTFTVPYRLMIGCFGVAPVQAAAITARTSGNYGGNMDYVGFTTGATAYFPVFAPGALVHLGDVHAVQGHGEILGTGVEVSAEIQFTVRVLKGWTIQQPRGENADYIFAVGNARPLDQAAQHATTEIVRWLEQDYGLDAEAAGFLLGQCVEYEVANFLNPAYSMVCKVPKSVLEPYRKH